MLAHMHESAHNSTAGGGGGGGGNSALGGGRWNAAAAPGPKSLVAPEYLHEESIRSSVSSEAIHPGLVSASAAADARVRLPARTGTGEGGAGAAGGGGGGRERAVLTRFLNKEGAEQGVRK
jgi:hypothetical protein